MKKKNISKSSKKPYNSMPKWVIDEMARRAPDIIGTSGKYDWHHAIISRATASGLPKSERDKINDPRNIIIIDHDIHINHPPSIKESCQILYNIYGYESVLQWYSSIVWKGNPPFVLLKY